MYYNFRCCYCRTTCTTHTYVLLSYCVLLLCLAIVFAIVFAIVLLLDCYCIFICYCLDCICIAIVATVYMYNIHCCYIAAVAAIVVVLEETYEREDREYVFFVITLNGLVK